MDKKRHNRAKISLGLLKGKPITSSVPSIAFRFNATAGEIEELYVSDGEQVDLIGDTSINSTASDIESSPSKVCILPKLTKRSTSIDVSPASIQDASPPSDPWRFFTDIKGKITKSVEGRITEYKTRTSEGENSPKTSKPTNNKDGGKESSSLSDSEELSESSISKTCGIASTTEGVEMSSDDDTPSLPEVQANTSSTSKKFGIRRRFRVSKHEKTVKKGFVPVGFLENLHRINLGVETEEQKLEVESGVDVLEEIIPPEIDNISIDEEQIINICKIDGVEIRTNSVESCFFAPEGFVDLRPSESQITLAAVIYGLRIYILSLIGIILYFTIPLTVYTYGFIAGNLSMFTLCYAYFTICTNKPECAKIEALPQEILPPIEEHEPLTKYEGWINEYPEKYDPFTYHISQTQPVYLRLQGNLLKVSHTRSKVPKRAMWNEGVIKHEFTQHRIYNLLGAKIKLLPAGLTKIRHWSKKYPICITLNPDQINYDYPVKRKGDKKRKGGERKGSTEVSQVFSKLQDDEIENDAQAFDEDEELEANASDLIMSAEDGLEMSPDYLVEDSSRLLDDDISFLEDWEAYEETNALETSVFLFGRTGREKEHWFRRLKAATHRGAKGSSTELPANLSDTLKANFTLYDEYLKFMSRFLQVRPVTKLVRKYNLKQKNKGTRKAARMSEKNENEFCTTFPQNVELQAETSQISTKSIENNCPSTSGNAQPTLIELEYVEMEFDTLWINSIINRILFDMIRNEGLITKIKERIQRKLSSIKLPYFIQELSLVELSLGSTPPLIINTNKPRLDQRGLWVDLDISYDGNCVIVLQTKLNLLKIKQVALQAGAEINLNIDQQLNEDRSAIFHSDVDDTAEDSTDDEAPYVPPQTSANPLDNAGQPLTSLGGTSTKSKKFIKMVDRFAESKFFQAAAGNKFIKRAIQGVSNTDLSLKVELRSLVGTLVVNIPEPPTDRLWIGFRPTPKMQLSAQPIVGERNITFLHVTSWIEKKLYKEFQKILVIPNMEDFQIPVMSDLLPE